MGVLQRFGEMYRKWRRGAIRQEICEVCGEELEIDPESSEGHCPVCENPER
jgi:rubrerythrin